VYRNSGNRGSRRAAPAVCGAYSGRPTPRLTRDLPAAVAGRLVRHRRTLDIFAVSGAALALTQNSAYVGLSRHFRIGSVIVFVRWGGWGRRMRPTAAVDHRVAACGPCVVLAGAQAALSFNTSGGVVPAIGAQACRAIKQPDQGAAIPRMLPGTSYPPPTVEHDVMQFGAIVVRCRGR